MLSKLTPIQEKYQQIQDDLMNASTTGDTKKVIEYNKELSRMQKAYDLIQEYVKYHNQLQDAQEMIDIGDDAEMTAMAHEERTQAQIKLEELEKALTIELLPKDPNDDKNIFLEIRPAAWGDEAGLFAAELLKMYLSYAQTKWRKAEIVEEAMNDVGGLKFAMVKISGESVYSVLKFESGVHRVQRIPDTESQGRVHTSTVTVAVMPEAEDVDINLNPADVEMDTMAASSAGWQNANKNQTGVRLRHIPSWLIVTIADTKSQLQNKEKARAVLKARLFQLEMDKKMAAEKDLRGTQIGTGDRSEKIRTYNFPQDRVTDHRIKESWSNIPAIMTGDIQSIIDKMIIENQNILLQKTEK
jgi:peptide chain release factor 1